MIRRNYFLFLLSALLVIAVLPACDSAVETDPEDSLPREDAIGTPAALESVLRSAYSRLQFAGAYGGIGYMGPDISTANAAFGGSFTTFENFETYDLIATSVPALTIWDDLYEVINSANEVTANVGNLDNISEALATQLTAEAKFVRALAYHNLLRWFARPYNPDGDNSHPGVPLVLEPTVTAGADLAVPRNTVAEGYQQINSDLTDAISGFTSLGLVANSEEGRADLGAAQALQARVKLYQGQYEAAATLATSVIESGVYGLVMSVNIQNIYSTNAPTNEDVFVIPNSATDNSGTNDFPSSFYLPSALGGRGDITVDPDLLAVYNDSLDLRQQRLVYALGQSGRVFGLPDAVCIEQADCWTHKFRSANFADIIRVIRLAEVYLIRAEAEARQDDGDDSQALGDLNTIRTRAGLPAYESVDDIDGTLVDEIILERRRELAFEGKYRHTLVRLGRPLENEGIVAPENQRILPIPQDELDANPNIEQNPGY